MQAERDEAKVKVLGPLYRESGDVEQELDEAINSSLMSTTAAILFSALEVEATLNLTGVVRLRNRFFDHNLERLRPEEKLSAIVAIVEQKIVERSDEIHVVTRRVFAARNKVAHPKSKAFDTWDEYKEDGVDQLKLARRSVEDMRTFLRLFAELVPTALDK